MVSTLVQVAVGGALGAVLRYLTRIFVERPIAADFPYATIAVNVAGSFVVGILFVAFGGLNDQTSRIAPFLIVGFLGGYTTFSAYSLDAWLLFNQGRIYEALVYVLGTVVLSLLAVFAGIALARSF